MHAQQQHRRQEGRGGGISTSWGGRPNLSPQSGVHGASFDRHPPGGGGIGGPPSRSYREGGSGLNRKIEVKSVFEDRRLPQNNSSNPGISSPTMESVPVDPQQSQQNPRHQQTRPHHAPTTTVAANLNPSKDNVLDQSWNALHQWGQMTRTIAHYRRIEKIGEGTFGQVYKATCLDTNQFVAMKKIRVHHPFYWGMPPTVIREIKILKALSHPNMVEMLEVVSSKGVEHLDEDDEREDEKRRRKKAEALAEAAAAEKEKEKEKVGTSGSVDANNSPPLSDHIVKNNKDPKNRMGKKRSNKDDRVADPWEGYKGNLFLVLEYVSHDLTGLLDMAYKFTEVQAKCVFRQLLDVLSYMHEHKYVHRDIKSSNILITSNFRVKLADFGLARCMEPPLYANVNEDGGSQDFTNKVITLWYRPPELLLGETKYGTAVDIWSAGCILAELQLGRPLFTGKSDLEQLKLIFDLIGSPTDQSWENFRELKLIKSGEVTIDKKRRPKLREKYASKMSSSALGLLEKLLELDPAKRLTASRALDHRYFRQEPVAPDQPEELGTIDLGDADDGTGTLHELKTRKRRRDAKVVAQKALEEAKRRGKDEKEAFDNAYWEHMRKSASAAKKERDGGTATGSTMSQAGMKGDQSAGKEDRKESSSSSSRRDRDDRGRSRDRDDRERRRDQDGREWNHDGDRKRYRDERDRRDNEDGDRKRSRDEKDKRDADKDRERRKRSRDVGDDTEGGIDNVESDKDRKKNKEKRSEEERRHRHRDDDCRRDDDRHSGSHQRSKEGRKDDEGKESEIEKGDRDKDTCKDESATKFSVNADVPKEEDADGKSSAADNNVDDSKVDTKTSPSFSTNQENKDSKGDSSTKEEKATESEHSRRDSGGDHCNGRGNSRREDRSRGESKERKRDRSRDGSKDRNKDRSKDRSKDSSKDRSKERSRHSSKDRTSSRSRSRQREKEFDSQQEWERQMEQELAQERLSSRGDNDDDEDDGGVNGDESKAEDNTRSSRNADRDRNRDRHDDRDRMSRDRDRDRGDSRRSHDSRGASRMGDWENDRRGRGGDPNWDRGGPPRGPYGGPSWRGGPPPGGPQHDSRGGPRHGRPAYRGPPPNDGPPGRDGERPSGWRGGGRDDGDGRWAGVARDGDRGGSGGRNEGDGGWRGGRNDGRDRRDGRDGDRDGRNREWAGGGGGRPHHGGGPGWDRDERHRRDVDRHHGERNWARNSDGR